MTSTAPVPVLHFGQLLVWECTDDGHAAWFRGRRHEIGLAYAQQIGGGCRPGWHFADHPDLPAGSHLGSGPRLGGRIEVARRMAEVWVLTDERDREPADHSPSILTAEPVRGAELRHRRDRDPRRPPGRRARQLDHPALRDGRDRLARRRPAGT